MISVFVTHPSTDPICLQTRSIGILAVMALHTIDVQAWLRKVWGLGGNLISMHALVSLAGGEFDYGLALLLKKQRKKHVM